VQYNRLGENINPKYTYICKVNKTLLAGYHG